MKSRLFYVRREISYRIIDKVRALSIGSALDLARAIHGRGVLVSETDYFNAYKITWLDGSGRTVSGPQPSRGRAPWRLAV